MIWINKVGCFYRWLILIKIYLMHYSSPLLIETNLIYFYKTLKFHMLAILRKKRLKGTRKNGSLSSILSIHVLKVRHFLMVFFSKLLCKLRFMVMIKEDIACNFLPFWERNFLKDPLFSVPFCPLLCVHES